MTTPIVAGLFYYTCFYIKVTRLFRLSGSAKFLLHISPNTRPDKLELGVLKISRVRILPYSQTDTGR